MAALQTSFEDFIKIVDPRQYLHLQNVVPGHFGKTGVHAAIVSLSTSPGGGHCPLVRDSEPVRLLDIQTSPSLYMLIAFTYTR